MIRKSTLQDLDNLLALFDEARATIATLGIDQWQNGYPSREVIERDIERGESYLYEENGETLATFAMLREREPTYDIIYDGAWLTGDTVAYTAIHRFAIAVRARGGGIAGEILAYAGAYSQGKCKPSLRIDTHEGNIVMRRMLEKNGFVHCGRITLTDGASRVAYEKLLNN